MNENQNKINKEILEIIKEISLKFNRNLRKMNEKDKKDLEKKIKKYQN